MRQIKLALQEPAAEVEARQEGFRLLAHLAGLGASKLSKWMSQRVPLWEAISNLPAGGLGELQREGLLLTLRVLEEEGAAGLSLPDGTSPASIALTNASLVRLETPTFPSEVDRCDMMLPDLDDSPALNTLIALLYYCTPSLPFWGL